MSSAGVSGEGLWGAQKTSSVQTPTSLWTLRTSKGNLPRSGSEPEPSASADCHQEEECRRYLHTRLLPALRGSCSPSSPGTWPPEHLSVTAATAGVQSNPSSPTRHMCGCSLGAQSTRLRSRLAADDGSGRVLRCELLADGRERILLPCVFCYPCFGDVL